MMKKDILTAGLTAALGAGVVTSWCVGHGQNPLLAFLITLIAGIFAAVCHQVDLI